MTNRKTAEGASQIPHVRLTSEIRNKILDRVIGQTFDARCGALAEDVGTLASLVHADLYTPSVRRAMAALPRGFLDEDASLRVQVGGQVCEILMRGRRVSNRHAQGTVAKSYEAGSEIGKLFSDLEEHTREVRESRYKARLQAKVVLESCATLRQLLETWPEIRPFVADLIDVRSTSRALTVPIKQLNAELGLSSPQVPGVRRPEDRATEGLPGARRVMT